MTHFKFEKLRFGYDPTSIWNEEPQQKIKMKRREFDFTVIYIWRIVQDVKEQLNWMETSSISCDVFPQSLGLAGAFLTL